MANICGDPGKARVAADYRPSSPDVESGLQEPNSGTINSKTSSSATTSVMVSAGSDRTNGGTNQGCFLGGQILEAPNLRKFTFLEIQTATRNFRPNGLIGVGGFGCVYKAWVDEKMMNPTTSRPAMAVAIMHGNEEWQKFLTVHLQSDINLLGRFSHPNLVKLLGYCWEGKELFLVNEFMAQRSLKDHLFTVSGRCPPLSWEQRLKIAIGAARGLVFLHASEKKAMYRDFKASEILLDADYNAKLSDFGLAKLGSTGNSRMTIMPTRTHGYAAPEYVISGLLYEQSDVYGFGVMILEMLSGQLAKDPNRPKGQTNIIDWAKSLADRRKLSHFMDSRLKGQYNSKQAHQAVHVALSCLAGEPRSRPSMKVVLEALEQI
ncbi:probable serine/threonine-protein kinase PIX13 [Triticum dicoccoides]|uniref:probable serine/threonine-protein kinase PIX13 n=1 Tax=Triticum dicoccoides TaxID=85692 RepID=UPI000E7C8086|nr:probable serine/threonine-protein kinase PIX13 [Triticum dicoccoides]